MNISNATRITLIKVLDAVITQNPGRDELERVMKVLSSNKDEVPIPLTPPRTKERTIATYNARKAAGKCTRCSSNAPLAHGTMCEVCYDKHKQYKSGIKQRELPKL